MGFSAILAEIKEISEKKRKEEETVLAVAAGNSHPTPDLSFTFVDSGVHDELYQIVKFSCEELCPSQEHSGRCMRVYADFLERFYGIAPRPQGIEDAEEVVKVKNGELKRSSGSGGESAVSGDTEIPENSRVAQPGHANEAKTTSGLEDGNTASSRPKLPAGESPSAVAVTDVDGSGSLSDEMTKDASNKNTRGSDAPLERPDSADNMGITHCVSKQGICYCNCTTTSVPPAQERGSFVQLHT